MYKSLAIFLSGLVVGLLVLAGILLTGRSNIGGPNTINQNATSLVSTTTPIPNSFPNWQTFNSLCNFRISVPPTWGLGKSGEDVLISAPFEDCLFVVDPIWIKSTPGIDYREGSPVHVRRVKIGSTIEKMSSKGAKEIVTINSTQDFCDKIGPNRDFPFPTPLVSKVVTIGSIEGLTCPGIGVDARDAFLFVHGDYIYGVTYRPQLKDSTGGKAINQIISTLSFSD